MALPLLLVTPRIDFGAEFRDGLDSSRFDLFSTSDFTEAVRYVRKNDCLAVILDIEFEDVELSVVDIGFALRQLKPGLRLVLITGENSHPDAEDLSPVAAFARPVVFTEMNKLFSQLADAAGEKTIPVPQPAPEPQPAADTGGPAWLRDVSKAAQHLTRLTLESSAQAALITRQNELWAYAGQLSRDAAQELTGSLQHYWDAQSESDLLRFVRLLSTDAQHMLYARKLAENVLLALVFDAETPFSTIRSQANKLIKNLSEAVPSEAPKPVQQVAVSASVKPVIIAPDVDDEIDNDMPPISALLGEVPPPIPPKSLPRITLPWEVAQPVDAQPVILAEKQQDVTHEVEPIQMAVPMAKVESKLDDVRELVSVEVVHPLTAVEAVKEVSRVSELVEIPHPVSMVETMPSIVRPAEPAQFTVPVGNPGRENKDAQPEIPAELRTPGLPAIRPAMDETRVSRVAPSGSGVFGDLTGSQPRFPENVEMTRKQDASKDPQSVAETRPQATPESNGELAHRILLESPSPALVNLSYFCLLIPRFDHHLLVGDVVARLNEWVPQVCIAFAWRLEHISVRPEYLQWVVRVPPNTAPGYVIRIIRQQTSARLFAEFPRFRADNPSDDFWAPGYLIIGSSDPHHHQLVRDHIKRTRGMQGLTPRE